MTAVGRDAAALERRKSDLLLASDLMRWHAAGALAEVEPAVERATHWVLLARCVRAELAAFGRAGIVFAAGGGTVLGAAALRQLIKRRRWLSRALVAWRLWRALRRRS